ncbi:hypothetical protein KY366_00105 [Candidatus Woesearchaeota archaeon]|nr:hypothetical protein [Candidatus Woesearchaeota archaeon]
MGNFKRNFNKRRSGRGRFDRNRPRFNKKDRGRDRGSERHEMHKGICDKCGKECEVPFRPTEGKPLYCNDCFKDKSREAGSRSGFGRPIRESGPGPEFRKPVNNENFDIINKKLDKILNMLEAAKEPEKAEEKEQAKKNKQKEQPRSKKPKKKARKKRS